MAQRELEALPQKIEALETEQQDLFNATADPEFYKKEKSELTAIQSRLEAIEIEIETAYQRWEELEKMSD